MFGSCSMVESSKTDCALSVTGPYESTAIVTGPMPRKPNATRPNANTAGAIMPMSAKPRLLTRYGDAHQQHDAHAEPVGAEVAGDEPGQDVERRAAFLRRGHDLAHVRRLGRREDLDELGNDRAGERAAGDDRRELPPERAVAERRDEQVRRDVGQRDRHDRRQPHQARQRRLEVHRRRVLVLAFASASLTRYETPEAITITMRITKIQTSSWTCTTGLDTASRMNEISATPVTP